MAEQGTLARPYAQAAFELAQAAGTLPAWSQFLQFTALAVTEPGVDRFLSTPGANLRAFTQALGDIAREQLGGSPLFAGANAPGVNFLRLLVENRRLDLMPQIAARFEMLKTEAENALDATLTTATPVSDEHQSQIVDSLKKRFGRQIRLTVAQDPALIGGARLQVGDRVIDGTVRTGLDKLATALRV